MFTQVIIRKWKMDGCTTVGRTYRLTDNQQETIIPRHYCVAGYKKQTLRNSAVITGTKSTWLSAAYAIFPEPIWYEIKFQRLAPLQKHCKVKELWANCRPLSTSSTLITMMFVFGLLYYNDLRFGLWSPLLSYIKCVSTNSYTSDKQCRPWSEAAFYSI